MKLQEQDIKIVERVLKRPIPTLINLNEMQFRFMPEKGTVDAIFIVRRKQDKYQKKDKKLYTVLLRLSVPRLIGIQLSGHSILLQHFKIRLLLIRCCRNSLRETLC